MKMDKVAGSSNDEFYTPYYAIEPLLKYLKPESTIWCPFDKEESLFVQTFLKEGHKVIYTHIENGQDFFEQETPENVDYIISNPPYSLKTEVFENLFARNVPFAMLVGVVGLFESQKRFNMFKDNEFEQMMFNLRISYMLSYEEKKPSKNPPFSSIYLCHKTLPEKIVFEKIDKNKVNIPE